MCYLCDAKGVGLRNASISSGMGGWVGLLSNVFSYVSVLSDLLLSCQSVTESLRTLKERSGDTLKCSNQIVLQFILLLYIFVLLFLHKFIYQ